MTTATSDDLFAGFNEPPASTIYRTPSKIAVETVSIRKRDAGISSSSENAERSCPGFGDRAREFILNYLAVHGPTSGEVITDAAIAAGITPHDQRAFGGPYQSLLKRRKIQKVAPCVRLKGNKSGGGWIYELVSEAK